MKTKPLYDQLREHLANSVGDHNRIAKETGVPQSTISRIHLGKACPTLHKAQPLLDWFAANSGKTKASARRIANARGRIQAAGAGASPAAGQ